MPLSETISSLVATALIASLIALAWPAGRQYLARRRAWVVIALGGLIFSGASWFITDENRAGTLLQRVHGWPKIYSAECLSPECSDRGDGINLIYFLGNSLVYIAGLLLLWTLVSLLLALRGRRRTAPSP